MIVSIPSSGPTVDSQMDDRFGRAPYFAFFDTESGSSRVEANPHAGGSGGVGLMAVLGGNADGALKASSITVVMQNPDVTVEAAYSAWKKNSENS